jgi:ATP-dependent Clp protease ATP-binding subunit ClpA
MLTEKVRRKPYSIVLFDEIEKGNFDFVIDCIDSIDSR